MKGVKFILASFSLMALLIIGSSFASSSDDPISIIDIDHGNIECSACHASWMVGTGTIEDFLEIKHSVSVSYFEDYISNYRVNLNERSSVDIEKMTKFIESL